MIVRHKQAVEARGGALSGVMLLRGARSDHAARALCHRDGKYSLGSIPGPLDKSPREGLIDRVIAEHRGAGNRRLGGAERNGSMLRAGWTAIGRLDQCLR